MLRLATTCIWDRPSLASLLCLELHYFTAESEDVTPSWRRLNCGITLENQAFDDISAGGWTSSFTGEWLSREVMDGYGEMGRTKLRPLLDHRVGVLEIGCASGITMLRLAPLCASYV